MNEELREENLDMVALEDDLMEMVSGGVEESPDLPDEINKLIKAFKTSDFRVKKVLKKFSDDDEVKTYIQNKWGTVSAMETSNTQKNTIE